MAHLFFCVFYFIYFFGNMQLSVFAGKDISIDEFLPPDIPEYSERARTAAADPVACAEWFHVVISAVSS